MNVLFPLADLNVLLNSAAEIPSAAEIFKSTVFSFNLLRILISAGAAAGVGIPFYKKIMKGFEAQNAMYDHSDINQHEDDQHIAFPEEIMERFDFFPDRGAHSPVKPNSLISHVMLSNKGVRKVEATKFAKENEYDEDGELLLRKGAMVCDEDGFPETEILPMFAQEDVVPNFIASSMEEKEFQKLYDPSQIPYNPTGGREKMGGKYKTLAEHINNEWVLPYYETQRPIGCYMVDKEPVNTMLLAITRAGKGQTIIEETLDMWTREIRKNNIIVNDPKAEIYEKFLVRATYRGYECDCFNLMNPDKTDFYNPLVMAGQAAREGDIKKCASYVDSIAAVFFPQGKGDDAFWQNSARNAFKRAAYGMIDYYLEQERLMRQKAKREHWDLKVLDARVDELWGKVTLYNCYQMFVQLSSQTKKNPIEVLKAQWETPEGQLLTKEEKLKQVDKAKKQSVFWKNNTTDADLLSLYFNATEVLPRNDIRQQLMDAHNALSVMAGSDKTISSIYGICITSMSFFTDPTIYRMTAGTPRQNVDLLTLPFPRMVGVQFHPDLMKKENYINKVAVWSAYRDASFSEKLGKEFDHQDLIGSDGWAKYYFDGIFESSVGYIKLEIKTSDLDFVLKTYYFRFEKGYRTSIDGKRYLFDPITKEKIVKDGTLQEMIPLMGAAKFTTRPGTSTFKGKRIIDPLAEKPKVSNVHVANFKQTTVHYTERPKFMFMVTPPHLTTYAKLILILIKQCADINFDQSYTTKENQKPLYMTRFMLDEVGNLQSDKNGIEGLQTMLSIGLGQDLQFTLVLQTLQQLRDVYGDSVDKIIQGNVANIIFLKSTDDTMMETLTKMSGKTHRTYAKSKSITIDGDKLFLETEAKRSYSIEAVEEPVIKMNDLAFLNEAGPGQSIVFQAGKPPIWNRNETVLPMSYRLFDNTITDDGKKYSLTTIPSNSQAAEFDVRQNMPDFVEMLQHRMNQASYVEEAKRIYKEAYGYTDYEITLLDTNVYADEIMQICNDLMNRQEDEEDTKQSVQEFKNGIQENHEVTQAARQEQEKQKVNNVKLYARKTLSRNDLMVNGSPNHSYDLIFISAFKETRAQFEKDRRFTVSPQGLFTAAGKPLIYRSKKNMELLQEMKLKARDPRSRIYQEDDRIAMEGYEVTDDFYVILTRSENWDFARGSFDDQVYQQLRREKGL